MNNQFKPRIYIIPILVIAVLTAFDQLTKHIIDSTFELFESKPLIENVFSITYIHNAGIAWGMFQGKRIIFLILTFVVLCGCFYIYTNIYGIRKFLPLRIGIVFLISGAIGNMIDRIKLGYVIDFLSFDLINFPVFNVADIFVTCSMIFIFLLIAFKYSDEDINEMIKPIKQSDEDA